MSITESSAPLDITPDPPSHNGSTGTSPPQFPYDLTQKPGPNAPKNFVTVIMKHLTNDVSVKTLIDSEVPSYLLPTEEFREIYEWAIKEGAANGKAPTVFMFKNEYLWATASYYDHLKSWGNGIDLEEGTDVPLEWALKNARAIYARNKFLNDGMRALETTSGEEFQKIRQAMTTVAEAPRGEVETLIEDIESGLWNVGYNDDVAALEAHDGIRMTDVGNSYRLINLGADTLRYVHAWGKWLVYRDGRYILDEKNAIVTEFAKQVPQVMLDNLPEPEYDAEGFDVSTRPAEIRFANASENGGKVQAMITFARGADGVLVEHEILDSNPELLNVKNVTLNLRSGEAQPHNPDDLMTMQAPVTYDADTKFEGSLWESCLETWQPDDEVRRYLQIRAGACATGIPTETFDVDYGLGANGKSKFHSAVQHVLGPYAAVPHKSLLVVQQHEQHSTEVARLFRVRMALASELEARCTLNEAMVKNITGGDRISARRMREDPWEFDPSHTMILFSNYKPIIKGTDQGIWRRVRLVPWDVTIPKSEQDTELEQKLRAESSIILNWILEGARIFLNEGLTVPDSIRVATDEYQAEENFVGRFMAECLTFDNPGARLSTAKITALAEQWMRDQGHKWTLNMKDISSALERAGARNVGRVRNEFGDRETTWQGVDTVNGATL